MYSPVKRIRQPVNWYGFCLHTGGQLGLNNGLPLKSEKEYEKINTSVGGGGGKLICDLITEETYLEDVKCNSWEELVDIGGGLLVKQGRVEPRFLQSIKDTIAEYGSYMVLVDDIAFFHGRPEAGVKDMAMSLVLLRDPVFLGEKRIKAAITFAAVDKNSHLQLMRELGGYLQDEEFLSLLRNNGSKAEIMKKLQEGAEMV
ncbi:MAG: hypothetical protein DBY06_05805 [Clostridiales bacterium]|nr:MAG: hypothetical protein DBY06_05805 [Clostridiales bacterium]